MSYFRPVRVSELIQWLLDNGFAEESAGYGHVSAEELAEALVKKYDILTVSNSPT